jgi:two-component system response regulator HydG
MRREIDRLREAAGMPADLPGIVGASRAMEDVIRRIRLVAPTRMNVLITGESGTGKELVARAIHALSPRRDSPFLPLNCAAIPETLLESELFGHEKGAFTGATLARPGKLESAEGGTLFLDEVGDVSLAIQSKLLRAIEQKEVQRVGGSRVLRVDVRILAATNQDLKVRVEEKAFREDLFYRLNVFGIVVPPLRDRREDIPRLAEHLLARIAEENGTHPKRLSPAALKGLLAFRWPGNVRQMRNALETATLVCQGDEIGPGDLPTEVTQGVLPPSSPEPIPLPASRTLTEIERDAIREALAKTGGNKTQAAKILGIGLRTLHRKVKEYGIG